VDHILRITILDCIITFGKLVHFQNRHLSLEIRLYKLKPLSNPKWKNQTETYYYYITNTSEIPPVINGCSGDFASRSGLDADIDSDEGSEGYLEVIHRW
jgi:hypothetical protein